MSQYCHLRSNYRSSLYANLFSSLDIVLSPTTHIIYICIFSDIFKDCKFESIK